MVLAVGCWPVVAQAQPREECRDRHVDHEIERALGQRSRNRDLAAFHLRALMQRCPAPRVRAQLGLEEALLEHWQDAHVLLRDALASADDEWVTSQRGRLLRALHDVDEHLPRVSPQTNVPGAELRVDGALVGTLPLPSPWVLAGGSGALELSAPGYQVLRRTVSLAAGELFREMMTLAPSPAPDTVVAAPAPSVAAPSVPVELPVEAPRRPSAERSSARLALSSPRQVGRGNPSPGRSAAPWVLVGGGVVLTALGGVLWALRDGAVGNCTVQTDAIACPSAADASRAQDAAGLGLAANLSVGIGAATAVSGVLWLLLRPSATVSHERVQVAVSPRSAGAVLSLGANF